MKKNNIILIKKIHDPILNTTSNVLKVTHEIKGENIISWTPINQENTDYQEVLEWVAEGNTIEEAD